MLRKYKSKRRHSATYVEKFIKRIAVVRLKVYRTFKNSVDAFLKRMLSKFGSLSESLSTGRVGPLRLELVFHGEVSEAAVHDGDHVLGVAAPLDVRLVADVVVVFVEEAHVLRVGLAVFGRI